MTHRAVGWMSRAACAAVPARTADSLFFGAGMGFAQKSYRRNLARARAICDGCPVWEECLRDVLAVPSAIDRYGVRAGLTAAERATLRDGPEPTREEREDAAVVFLGGQPVPRAQRSRRTA